MESLSASNNICANCGKGEENSNNLKKCSACLSVKYCSTGCQKAHRSQHKKECKKRAAELYDEKLFADPPPPEECPLCFTPYPLDPTKTAFKSCCGKQICGGCIIGLSDSERGGEICPFCRTPIERSEEEENKRVKKLTDCNHPYSLNYLAGAYDEGLRGLPQNYEKANQLWLKSGELGCHEAYCNLGNVYHEGRGVEVDKKKAKHYYELAAIGGDIHARHNLGCTEYEVGNHHRAFNHFIMAAKAGHKTSLDCVKTGFMDGDVTKDEYANTLRAHQKSLDEMKSDMRDKAAQSMKDGTMWVGEDL